MGERHAPWTRHGLDGLRGAAPRALACALLVATCCGCVTHTRRSPAGEERREVDGKTWYSFVHALPAKVTQPRPAVHLGAWLGRNVGRAEQVVRRYRVETSRQLWPPSKVLTYPVFFPLLLSVMILHNGLTPRGGDLLTLPEAYEFLDRAYKPDRTGVRYERQVLAAKRPLSKPPRTTYLPGESVRLLLTYGLREGGTLVQRPAGPPALGRTGPDGRVEFDISPHVRYVFESLGEALGWTLTADRYGCTARGSIGREALQRLYIFLMQ